LPDQSLLQNLGIIVLAGTSVALITRGIRLPAIVAYIVAGLLLGPAFGIVEFDPTMDVIAEAGIILLLFLVGLELSLGKLREVGKIALKTGVAQMAMTSAGVAAIALAFGTGVREAVFLSVALTFSSTVVVVKLLDQLQALDSRHGRVAVGVLLVQDVAVLLVLTFVAGVLPSPSV
jgi:Kef-type K+ transport system membrane component KefB